MSDRPDLLPWLAAPLSQGLALRAHALLLHGPGGVGQFELGLALAAGWLCEDAVAPAHACGHCGSCRLMAAQAHPDFHLLLPAALREPLGWTAGDEGEEGAKTAKTKAKPSKEIRVEAVRAAIDWGHVTSSRGRAKVMLLHPAQAINLVGANALLKTLEEPPGQLRLILTAQDEDSLLPTIRSRCQRLRLELPPAAQSLAWLAEQGVERPEVLLAAAGGQPLQAQALAAEGVSSDAWEGVPGAVHRGAAASLADWPLPRLIDALQKLCHDLMCVHAGGPPRYFGSSALTPLTRRNSPGWPRLAEWSRELTQAARHDEHPWHAGLRIEALVGQGARLWQTPRTSSLSSRNPLDTLGTR